MRPALAEIKTLEAYLTGTLSPAEQQDVAIRLLWDQAYAQKISLQQLAYEALQVAGRQQLREELKAIHNRLFPA